MAIDKNLKYEDALKRIEELVQLLENKEVSIEELTGKVKNGKELIEYCREKLTRTEVEINKIIGSED